MDGGQGPVEGAEQVVGGDGCLKDKAGDLGESVDAGIGAAGALGQGRFAGNAAQGGLQFALNGGSRRAAPASR